MGPALILFDIDGTLIHGHGAGSAAFTNALASVFDVEVDLGDYRFGGRTDTEIAFDLMARHGIEPHTIRANMEAVWSHYLPALAAGLETHRPALVPGVWEVLERLARDRDAWCVGLLTGNHEPAAWQKLRAVGVDGYFRMGAFGGWTPSRNELPTAALKTARELLGIEVPPERCVIIGDTPADIACARHVGARAVAVATGRYTVDDLAAHSPDLLLADMTETEPVLARLAALAG